MKVMETTAKKEDAIGRFLDSYLKGAVALTAGAKRARAGALMQEFYNKVDKKGLSENDLLKASAEKEAELKKQASKFGMKTKLNYMTDADHRSFNFGDVIETSAKTACAAVAGGICGVMAGMASTAMSVANTAAVSGKAMATGAAIGVFLPVAGVALTKATKLVTAQLTKSKTAEEKKNAEDYAAIKHAQLALKIMRKMIASPEAGDETDRDLQQTAMASSQTAIRTAVFNTTFSR